MKIVIFGAAGATGHALVTQALAQGHHVTAFVRTPAKFDLKHTGVSVAQGNVADAPAVERALSGQDAALCALGAATPLKRDPALVRGVENIVHAMERGGPHRLIYLSFLGVRGGRWQLSFLGRYVVAPLILLMSSPTMKPRRASLLGAAWIGQSSGLPASPMGRVPELTGTGAISKSHR